ncbi:hypothetical protein GCM10012319_30910 [Comamonas sp. KCTC 72670]|nr:hypothetical protein GCM10012319_30910 [Comamonas sp. KCTC 72670]
MASPNEPCHVCVVPAYVYDRDWPAGSAQRTMYRITSSDLTGSWLNHVLKPFVDRPFVDKPFVDRPFVDKPFVDKPFVDKPFVDSPFVDSPFVDTSPEDWVLTGSPTSSTCPAGPHPTAATRSNAGNSSHWRVKRRTVWVRVELGRFGWVEWRYMTTSGFFRVAAFLAAKTTGSPSPLG